jgi:serine/threonine-protein kinase
MSPEMTEAGIILGTASYMSPEQARGKSVDKRADIWSFGVVLFEMLTGKRLFSGETVSDTLASVLRQEILWSTLPAETPVSVRRLLRHCLERDPKERLRDIGDVRIGLKEEAVLEVKRSKPPARVLPWFVATAAVLTAVWALWARRALQAESRRVQQYELTFPSDVESRPDSASGLAFSPDGNIVATQGVRNKKRRVFVRELDSSEFLEIPEAATNGLTFSPDSTQLAVVGPGQVSSISLRDRQRAVWASDADLTGTLAWGGPGIVFSRKGALWIAPTPGGEPRELTTLDAARHEVLHASAIFLPGERTLLFTSFAAESGTERIEAVPVEGGARTVVLERATTPLWAPSGHLLFARDGAVLATEFDPDSVRVRGVATPVLPPGLVGASQLGTLALQVASNGSLVFMPGDFGVVSLVSVARDGSSVSLSVPPARYVTPRLSPDGRRVIVGRDHGYLEVVNLERGTRTRLTREVPGNVFCTWNLDGSRIVSRRFNVPFSIAADGSGRQEQVKGATSNDYPSGPGPDPDSILVTRIQSDTSADVFLLSLSGEFEPRALVATRAYEGGPQLSPDRRWLAYSSNESGQFEIHVRRLDDLDREWQVSEGGGNQVQWAASGREIYYRGGPALAAVPFDGDGEEPVIGKPQPLFKDEYDMSLGITIPQYDVTPDGRFLMLRREASSSHLRIVLNWTEELKRILAEAGNR